MKTQTMYIIFVMMMTQCKKQNIPVIQSINNPTATLISTEARLLDTAAFIGERYMHFVITFDVVAGDSDLFFSTLPVDYRAFVRILGHDTIHSYTPYRPLILTTLPEILPEEEIFKIEAGDTARLQYFGLVIAHGRWTQFYMQAYGFPYSLGRSDDTYESMIVFDRPYTTDFPH